MLLYGPTRIEANTYQYPPHTHTGTCFTILKMLFKTIVKRSGELYLLMKTSHPSLSSLFFVARRKEDGGYNAQVQWQPRVPPTPTASATSR